jgi:predicted ATPase with chaperone activity
MQMQSAARRIGAPSRELEFCVTSRRHCNSRPKAAVVENALNGPGFASELIRQGAFGEPEAPADLPPAVAAAGAHAAAHPPEALPGDGQSSAAYLSRGKSSPFVPAEPTSLESAGLSKSDVEALVLKYLLNVGAASGRQIAEQVKLPFGVMQPLLQLFKAQLLVMYKNAAAMSDYEYELGETGVERARRFHERCSYFGAAPVSIEDYVESVRRQSMRNSRPRLADMCRAMDDLLLELPMISQIGQAVNAGLGLFLYGDPGNGKTSIAERLVRGLGQTVWIPRTIGINGEIIRLFDPATHEPVREEAGGLLDERARYDRRWVQIRRPTVVVGGELTLDHLEITHNSVTGINESPVQLKSNGGALVIDDFGRQRVSIEELLNRWIVPLEKRVDYLTLPTGRQLQIPFDQLLVFATNMEPNKLVDEAFLRRIPYKIEVQRPTEAQYKELFRRQSAKLGFPFRPPAIDYLLETHYKARSRPFRFCHVRDLLLQVRSYCEFHERPLDLTAENLDVAVKNYFAGLA